MPPNLAGLPWREGCAAGSKPPRPAPYLTAAAAGAEIKSSFWMGDEWLACAGAGGLCWQWGLCPTAAPAGRWG